jgi:regulator of protease activity HflC (stomatin/prohibitin superfamily)
LFWVVPVRRYDPSWIDQRTITRRLRREQTLTSDTVPVNVDAVLFWMVHDAEKAALECRTTRRPSAGRRRRRCATSSAAPRSPICCAAASGSKASCSS